MKCMASQIGPVVVVLGLVAGSAEPARAEFVFSNIQTSYNTQGYSSDPQSGGSYTIDAPGSRSIGNDASAYEQSSSSESHTVSSTAISIQVDASASASTPGGGSAYGSGYASTELDLIVTQAQSYRVDLYQFTFDYSSSRYAQSTPFSSSSLVTLTDFTTNTGVSSVKTLYNGIYGEGSNFPAQVSLTPGHQYHLQVESYAYVSTTPYNWIDGSVTARITLSESTIVAPEPASIISAATAGVFVLGYAGRRHRKASTRTASA